MEQQERETVQLEPELTSSDPSSDGVPPAAARRSSPLNSTVHSQPSDHIQAAAMDEPHSTSPSAPLFTTPSYFGLSALDANTPFLPGLRPQFSRAAKDVSDPTESTQRTRASLERSVSSTRTAINTLFKATSPNSQPLSRQASFVDYSSSIPSMPAMRSLASQSLALGTHIYTNGLLEGRHSDICINAFGGKYKLHRLVLEQSPYFASTFSGPWLEASAKEIDLHPEDTDVNITREAFELALKRLYGCPDTREETFHCLALLPTACWLELSNLISDSVENIIRTLEATNLSPAINLVTSSYYGKAGDRILQSANILLKREGATIPTRCWDHIPGAIVKETIGADDFFITSEWDRWILAKKVLNRRLKLVASLQGLHHDSPASQTALLALRRAGRPYLSRAVAEIQDGNSIEQNALREWVELYNNADITALHGLLDDDIYYVHLDFEALQTIRGARDIFGVPVIASTLITDALWEGIELRQKVLNADTYDLQLGLSKICNDHTQSMGPSGAVEPRDRSTEVYPSYGYKSSNSSLNSESHARRHLIPRVDCNISIGANPKPLKASEERKRARNMTRYQSNDANTSTEVPDNNMTSDHVGQEPEHQRYSHIPPFRFSVEFPNPRLLDERKHVHSQTVFYAGSFWNIYIQKLRKGSKEIKVPQLGVYLRRAGDTSLAESSFYSANRFRRSVDERIGDLERDLLQTGSQRVVNPARSWPIRPLDDTFNVENDTTSGSITSIQASSAGRPALERTNASVRAATDATDPELPPMSHFSSAIDTSDDDETSKGVLSQAQVIPPYVDSRPFVRAYFKIFCPSGGGRSLNIWESVPDNFSLRQSWGWRSSSLMADMTPGRRHSATEDDPVFFCFQEELRKLRGIVDGDRPEEESDLPELGTDLHLRFSVVIGLV